MLALHGHDLLALVRRAQEPLVRVLAIDRGDRLLHARQARRVPVLHRLLDDVPDGVDLGLALLRQVPGVHRDAGVREALDESGEEVIHSPSYEAPPAPLPIAPPAIPPIAVPIPGTMLPTAAPAIPPTAPPSARFRADLSALCWASRAAPAPMFATSRRVEASSRPNSPCSSSSAIPSRSRSAPSISAIARWVSAAYRLDLNWASVPKMRDA